MSRGDYDGLRDLCRRLNDLKDDTPKIAEKLLIGEGVYCVSQARKIVTDEDKVDTGAYRLNFHCGDRNSGRGSHERSHDGVAPRRAGNTFEIDVYNALNYASFLEMGFRSHWVPAEYLSPELLERVVAANNKPLEKVKGIYVGPRNSYVPGIWPLKKAVNRMERTQEARLERKLQQEIKERINKK